MHPRDRKTIESLIEEILGAQTMYGLALRRVVSKALFEAYNLGLASARRRSSSSIPAQPLDD